MPGILYAAHRTNPTVVLRRH